MSILIIERKFRELDRKEQLINRKFTYPDEKPRYWSMAFVFLIYPSDVEEKTRENLPPTRRFAYQLPGSNHTLTHGFGPVLSNISVNENTLSRRSRPATAPLPRRSSVVCLS